MKTTIKIPTVPKRVLTTADFNEAKKLLQSYVDAKENARDDFYHNFKNFLNKWKKPNTMKTKTKRYLTRDAEAGNIIDHFDTLKEAMEAILQYEAQDKKEKTYSPGFYEVYDTQTEMPISVLT